MNIVPQVKCHRCGETFSAMRSTCPNCGSRRTAQSTRTPNTTAGNNRGTAANTRAVNNAKWQLIFGLILVVAVILAVIVMVSTGLNSADSSQIHVAATPSPVGAIEGTGEDGLPIIESAPSPSPTPPPQIQSVNIRYVTTDYTGKEFTMRLSNDEEITLNAQVWPADTVPVSEVKWSVDHPDVLEVTDNGDGTCTCHIIGTIGGGVQITAECYGVTANVRVYCVN